MAISEKVAELRGKRKGFFKYIIPPSAQDFMGLMYDLIGKGERGNRHTKWIKEQI